MTTTMRKSSAMRTSPYIKGSPSASPSTTPPTPTQNNRPRTMMFGSPPPQDLSHSRTQSFSPLGTSPSMTSRVRAHSTANRNSSSSTFAPLFIKSEAMMQSNERTNGIENENDFSGKRYVWLKDPELAFVRGWVIEDLGQGYMRVQCEDGSMRDAGPNDVDKVNPAKFDKADDMAELTHLNEASVVHNLQTRYMSDLIYTYSGLFLVTVNPYCPLPIYSNEYVKMYKGQSREDTRPHIFAMADHAFRNLIDERVNQSILVTGESGAGKTENTKKVIQYLVAVATTDTPRASRSPSKQFSNLSQQILRANPILEAFGNAQTVRNNNSSRFGKFIRIEFNHSGQVAGAFIDWYLLEKSRVVKLNAQERTYHIFYQLLSGADQRLKDKLLLSGASIEDFAYTRAGNDTITGVSDKEEWNRLVEAFHIMNFSEPEQLAILKTIAAVLHLGNISVMKESRGADQACVTADAYDAIAKACRLLGIQSEPFVQALLHPKVKAGREWVEKVQTPEQVRLAIDALSKGIYERGFGDLVSKINRQLDRSGMSGDDTNFIGVLDIAGFEIFEDNSFEQLCINYTNEKLQQFFNHHMFVLEQEEYAREQIEWQFIDFGKDLQPTIDLIELPNPIGIFSCLDEDCVMPKASDKSFTDKLHSLWEKKTPKYKPSRLAQGFVLTHYAAEVEYSTEGWLEKNKDPLNDNVTRLLATSTDKYVANLFSDCSDEMDDISSPRSRVKKGLFRTVAQRHKEQLSSLMNQLHQTHPHFVRCILPNHKKKPKQFNAPLVLDQLRCNGVLEGIRIARTGFPNRLLFAEFRSRYEVLCRNMPKGYLEGQKAATIILDKLELDKADYRVGLTKVFFRAGVLAELEEQRDSLIREIVSRFQSVARGFSQRRIAYKRLYRAEATRIIQRNMNIYLDLQANPWWRLFVKMKPLLGATRTAGEVKKRDEKIHHLQDKIEENLHEKQKIEEERRRAHGETQRIRQTLESERALALDKEEIFKRLQNREVELSEKLSEALADQEGVEDQLDGLLQAKTKADEELDMRRAQVEQAAAIITRLEDEKKQLQQEVGQLCNQWDEVEKKHTANDGKLQELDSEVRMLRSQVSLKDRKLHELQEAEESRSGRMESSEQELKSLRSQLGQKDRKLKELEDFKNGRAKVLDSELAALKSQLALKDRKLKEVQDSQDDNLRALDQENKGLRNQLSISNRTLRETEEGKNRKLEAFSHEHNSLKNELNARNRQIQDLEAIKDERDDALDQENRMLRSQLGQKERKLQELESKLLQAHHDIDTKLATATKEAGLARSQNRDLTEQNRSTHQKLLAITSRASEHESQLASREAELARLQRDLSARDSEKASRDNECRALVTRHEGAQNQLKDLEQAMNEMMSDRANLEREALDAKKAVEEGKAKRDVLQLYLLVLAHCA